VRVRAAPHRTARRDGADPAGLAGCPAAREALDLAAHPGCQYAWGEAYFANHEPTLAKRAFTRALAVRQRIEHPGVAETEKWLARVG
jgi:hypothetical protein